jgi:hypothetical protein
VPAKRNTTVASSVASAPTNGKHAADRERHDEQGKDHGWQSDGAVGENACGRIGDTGRKGTACQFGYSVCLYPGGVALVLDVLFI